MEEARTQEPVQLSLPGRGLLLTRACLPQTPPPPRPHAETTVSVKLLSPRWNFLFPFDSFHAHGIYLEVPVVEAVPLALLT